MPPFTAGTVLGDEFLVKGLLGEGGAGVVYDAVRTLTGERVALKILHTHLAGDRQLRGRFEREARILERLRGPHVAPVLDFGEVVDPRARARTLLYMALPRIEGPSLEDLMRRESPLPFARVADLLLQICDALKVAHEQGIVHRDLKPANVLLRGGTHVVVVDFGLAKIVSQEAATTELTAQNMVCGTPEYMAPEQARGEDLDGRCDLYAAGVILYQLLTQALPFTSPTPLGILTAHLTTIPIAPRERAPARDIPAALAAIAMHAMAREPSDRYPTATAMAAAILHARSEPDDADAVRPDAPHARTLPSFRVPPGVQTAAATPTTPPAAAAPIIPPAAAAAAAPTARTPLRRPGATAPAGSRLWMMIWIGAILASISIGIWLSLHTP